MPLPQLSGPSQALYPKTSCTIVTSHTAGQCFLSFTRMKSAFCSHGSPCSAPSLHFNLLNFISCLTWSSCLYAPRSMGLPWSPRQTEASPESTLQAHPRVPSTPSVFLAPADLSVPAQGLPLHKAFLPLDTQAVCTCSLLQLEV